MNHFLFTASAATLIGLFATTTSHAQDTLLVPPAPESATPAPQPAASARLAPPIPVGPYFAYEEPVFVAPVYVAPVYVAPVYVTPVYFQPVVPAPVIVAHDWYAPAYVAPHHVTVWSSPWSYKAEFEYATPFGSREVEYRVDRHGRVRIDYDD